MFAPLKLDKADLIAMPVNDNSNPLVANAGSHWTMLVYQAKQWWYMDSAGSSIPPYVVKIARTAQQLI